MKNSIKEHDRYIKYRIQQLGLSTTIKDDSGKEHHFYRGHEYIEIGGIKWAVTNVGADKETDSGLYFAFGEPKGYTAEQMLKGERKFAKDEYANVEFDSVKAYWGGNWRMPTEAEFRALLSSTTIEWIYNYQGSGVNGRLFTDKTDGSKKLFFPAVGHCYNGGIVYQMDSNGYYWSSSLLADDMTYGKRLYFSRGYFAMGCNDRCYGFPIRGVIGE